MATDLKGSSFDRDPELVYIENKFDELTQSLIKEGCDPGWVAHSSMYSGFRSAFKLEESDRNYFLENVQEILDEMADNGDYPNPAKVNCH